MDPEAKIIFQSVDSIINIRVYSNIKFNSLWLNLLIDGKGPTRAVRVKSHDRHGCAALHRNIEF